MGYPAYRVSIRWASLKIHISSLPPQPALEGLNRGRESSQINKLDSRLRGNDELLEVPR